MPKFSKDYLYHCEKLEISTIVVREYLVVVKNSTKVKHITWVQNASWNNVFVLYIVDFVYRLFGTDLCSCLTSLMTRKYVCQLCH